MKEKTKVSNFKIKYSTLKEKKKKEKKATRDTGYEVDIPLTLIRYHKKKMYIKVFLSLYDFLFPQIKLYRRVNLVSSLSIGFFL